MDKARRRRGAAQDDQLIIGKLDSESNEPLIQRAHTSFPPALHITLAQSNRKCRKCVRVSCVALGPNSMLSSGIVCTGDGGTFYEIPPAPLS